MMENRVGLFLCRWLKLRIKLAVPLANSLWELKENQLLQQTLVNQKNHPLLLAQKKNQAVVQYFVMLLGKMLKNVAMPVWMAVESAQHLLNCMLLMDSIQ